jgi:hypothetical protein
VTLYVKTITLGAALTWLFAGLALCSSAQAIEGPFYSEEGFRLASGESAQFKTGVRINKFVLSTSKLTLTCGGAESVRGSQFKGSSGHHPGYLTEKLLVVECTVAGNGAGCEVYKNYVATVPLIGTLAYPKTSPAKSDDILEQVHPESGSILMEIKFVGSACIQSSVIVEGSVTGEVTGASYTERIKVGEEPAEDWLGGVIFAPTNITSSWEELGESSFEEQRSTLTMDGEPAQLEFDQVFYLVTKNKWGVYT